MILAEIHRLWCNHDPGRLIREDYRALFNTVANAAACSGLQSDATCSTAPAISLLTTPAPAYTAARSGAPTGSTTSGTNICTLSPGRTSFPLRERQRHCETCHANNPYLSAMLIGHVTDPRPRHQALRHNAGLDLIRPLTPPRRTGQTFDARNAPAAGNLHLGRYSKPPATSVTGRHARNPAKPKPRGPPQRLLVTL